MVGAGAAEGSVDASNMLKPALSRGEIQCIGATTLEEYRKYIEKNGALERRFQPIIVNPPTVDETIEIIKGLKVPYELIIELRFLMKLLSPLFVLQSVISLTVFCLIKLLMLSMKRVPECVYER